MALRTRLLPAAALAAASLLAALPAAARERDRDRQEFKGVVTAVPDGKVGEWTVGGRTFTSDRATELDESEGPLAVGACAKVELRGGRVHEIDSEPTSDCR